MLDNFLQKDINPENFILPAEFENDFLIKNNLKSLNKIFNFYSGENKILCVTGFVGVGKYEVVQFSESFLNEDVLKINYICSESSTVDDILMYMFLEFEKYKKEGLISKVTVQSNDFLTQINSFLQVADKKFLITLSKFDLVQNENMQEILNCLYFFAKSEKVKLIFVSKTFDTDLIPQGMNYSTLVLKALSNEIFLDYLKFNNVVATTQKFEEIYKYTRGYYYSVSVLIFILKMANLTISDFLNEFLQSQKSFDKFLCQKLVSSLPKFCIEIISLLLIFRHGISKKVFEINNMFDEHSLQYLTERKVISEINRLYYVNDYLKYNSEMLFNPDDLKKYHEKLTYFYEEQIPLKPSERICIISRQTMKNELNYHRSFLIEKEDINEVETADLDLTNETDEFVKSFNQAKTFMDNYDYDSSLDILKGLLLLDNYENYNKFLPRIYENIIFIFEKKVLWSEALNFQNLLTDFYKKCNTQEEYYKSLYDTAIIYFKLYKTDTALKILTDVVNSNAKTKELIINAHLQLADIYLTQNDYDSAENNYEKIFEILDDSISAQIKSDFYFKYALFCDETDDISKAKEFYKKCIELNFMTEYTSSAYYNLAQLFLSENNQERAIELISESMTTDLKINNNEGLFLSNFELGKIYSKFDLEKSFYYYEQANNYAGMTGDIFLIAKSKLSIGDLNFFNHNYENALINYFEVYKMAKDSFSKGNLEKIMRRISDVKVKVSEELYSELENKYAR